MSTLEAIESQADWVIEPGQRWQIHLLYGGGLGGPYVVDNVQPKFLGSELVSLRHETTGARAWASPEWMRRAPAPNRTHWERLG